MSTKIEKLLIDMENSCESAGVAFAEHLRTVASNGREYATRKAKREEAESLKGWAEWFLRHTA